MIRQVIGLYRVTCSMTSVHYTQARYCFSLPTAICRNSFKYRHTRTTPEDTVNPLTTPTTIDSGALHVVSVPIGNLKDFTIRALDILRQVDYIVTTDRPATKALLDLIQVDAQGRLIHYSRTNRTATKEKLVELLRGGRSMALVCPSGTPCVGDVGGDLVRAMQADGVRVSAVPGACALTCALVVAGVTASPHEDSSSDSDRKGDSSSSSSGGGGVADLRTVDCLRDGSFFFGNVLPSAHGARLRVLRHTVGQADYPCVFYEVPRRLLVVLQDIAAVLPRRRVIVAHELTKLNESMHADTAEKLLAFYSRQEAYVMLKKGQLVLIIDSPGPGETQEQLYRLAEKRRRMRQDLSVMVSSSSDSQASVAKEALVPKNTQKKRRRMLLMKRRRERMIARIEMEQERIRMSMQINRTDATRT